MYSNMFPSMNMSSEQQRLAYLEQQYPQYSRAVMQPTPVKCSAVTSIEEARAAMISMDGTPNVFTNFSKDEIYVKYINLNGTATLDIYTKKPYAEMVQQSQLPDPQPQYATVDQLKDLRDTILAELQKMQGGMMDVQSKSNGNESNAQ